MEQSARYRRVRRYQKEDQIKTISGPEEASNRRSLSGKRESIRSPECRAAQAALTFDDGPDPSWTPRVLEALSQVEARATFFMIAPRALEYPHIVSAVLEAGHRVEFHCTEHIRHPHRSHREVESDAHKGLQALRSLGVEPGLWRTPWGLRAPWTEEVAESLGLRLVGWSADTQDWRGDPAFTMLRNIQPLLGPGSVVLMHDALGPGARRTGCKETVALVWNLVTHLRSVGCEPGLLSQDIGT